MARKIPKTAGAEAQRKRHAVAHVAVAAGGHLVVDGEHEAVITGLFGARREFGGDAAVLEQKDLHPFGAGGGGADRFDGGGRGMAGGVDRAEPRRRPRRGEFGAGPQQPGEAGRPDDHRRGQFQSEQLDALIAPRRARQQSGRKRYLGERGLVAAHGDLVARRAVDHVEHHARQAPARHFPKRPDAVSATLQRRRLHQTVSRYALMALSRNSLRFSARVSWAVAQSSVSSHCG